MGMSCLQGPHHGAQKSTSTGIRAEVSTTSVMKVSAVTTVVSWLTQPPDRQLELIVHSSMPKLSSPNRIQALVTTQIVAIYVQPVPHCMCIPCFSAQRNKP